MSDPRYRDPEYAKHWRAANPDKVRAQTQRKLERHRDENRARAAAHYAAHREDRKAKARAYYAAHREEAATTRMARKFGLTRETYAELVATHGGSCGICGLASRLGVDHDHATGQVRGLLCSKCNLLLGLGRDDPALLRSAADYLEAAR